MWLGVGAENQTGDGAESAVKELLESPASVPGQTAKEKRQTAHLPLPMRPVPPSPDAQALESRCAAKSVCQTKSARPATEQLCWRLNVEFQGSELMLPGSFCATRKTQLKRAGVS